MYYDIPYFSVIPPNKGNLYLGPMGVPYWEILLYFLKYHYSFIICMITVENINKRDKFTESIHIFLFSMKQELIYNIIILIYSFNCFNELANEI